MAESSSYIRVFGIGNPARGDDGLGPRFVASIEADKPERIVAEANYQLQVEDCLSLENCGAVVFVDASMSAKAPFELGPLSPDPASGLGSHSLPPGGLLALAASLNLNLPPAFVMAIRGEAFEPFCEELSARAEDHLQAALHFFSQWQKQWQSGHA